MSAPAYVTLTEAIDKLAGFGVSDSVPTPVKLTDQLLRMASDRLDALHSPFVGGRYSLSQDRQFPRDETLEGDVAGQVPDAVKEWVAMEAYSLSRDGKAETPVVSVSVSDLGSTTYAAPHYSYLERIQRYLLERYQEKTALRTPVSDKFA